MFSKKWRKTGDVECHVILTESDNRVNNCCNQSSTLQGSFVVTAKKLVDIYGFGVKLEGKARAVLLRKSKGGDRAEYCRNEFYFLQLPFKDFEVTENALMHLVPVNVEGNEEDFSSCTRMALKQRKQVYKFHLNFESLLGHSASRSLSFPASFKHDFGSVQYSLSVHMRLKPNSRFVRVCERILPPSRIPAMIPVLPSNNPSDESTRRIVRRREGYRPDTFVEGSFKLSRLGYLPGEAIEFSLGVENQCDSAINKISVSLVQKSAFRAGGYLKSVFQPLILREKVNLELKEMMKTGNLFEWEDVLRVPTDMPSVIMPTFKTDEKCLEIFHFVQFVVSLTGSGTLTGEIAIQVGTYRPSNSSESSFQAQYSLQDKPRHLI